MKDIDKELDTQIADYLQKHTTWTGSEDYEQRVTDLKQLINQARIDEAERFANAKINHQGRPAIFNPDGLPVSTPLTEEVTRLVNQAAKDRIKELKGE